MTWFARTVLKMAAASRLRKGIFFSMALEPSEAVVAVDVPAGEAWAYELRAGQTLRIVDLHGNQAVDTLFYNAHDYADRYSAQDTIRHQCNIYLTTGSKLISTRGTVLLTITADTCGRHDTL